MFIPLTIFRVKVKVLLELTPCSMLDFEPIGSSLSWFSSFRHILRGFNKKPHSFPPFS